MIRHLSLLLFAILCTGCFGEGGPTRYRVSGKVTFGGRPVPYGEVLFTPDSSKGNSGPQGIATIQNGKYDTVGSRAPGVAGGPTIVQVMALSDASGKLLCEYQFGVELPRSNSTQDIDIPATARNKNGSGPGI